MRPACDILTLRMPNIQRRPNSFDCGVFAIATATELALGRDPRLCYWDNLDEDPSHSMPETRQDRKLPSEGAQAYFTRQST